MWTTNRYKDIPLIQFHFSFLLKCSSIYGNWSGNVYNIYIYIYTHIQFDKEIEDTISNNNMIIQQSCLGSDNISMTYIETKS